MVLRSKDAPIPWSVFIRHSRSNSAVFSRYSNNKTSDSLKLFKYRNSNAFNLDQNNKETR